MQEFLRERGLTPDEDKPGQKIASNEKLPAPGTLLEVYKEQYHYIQQIESRDFGLFVMVIAVAVALWTLASLGFIEANKHHLFGIIMTLIFLSAAAIHITIKNVAIRWSRFLIIGQIEKALGLRNNGILPAGTQFVLPASFSDFLVRFLFSPVGPKAIVYVFIMELAIIEIRWDLLGLSNNYLFPVLLFVPLVLAFTSV